MDSFYFILSCVPPPPLLSRVKSPMFDLFIAVGIAVYLSLWYLFIEVCVVCVCVCVWCVCVVCVCVVCVLVESFPINDGFPIFLSVQYFPWSRVFALHFPLKVRSKP